MKKNLSEIKDISADEPVVIPDECGDTLWDAVLLQDEKIRDEETSKRIASLLNKIDAVKEFPI